MIATTLDSIAAIKPDAVRVAIDRRQRHRAIRGEDRTTALVDLRAGIQRGGDAPWATPARLKFAWQKPENDQIAIK